MPQDWPAEHVPRDRRLSRSLSALAATVSLAAVAGMLMGIRSAPDVVASTSAVGHAVRAADHEALSPNVPPELAIDFGPKACDVLAAGAPRSVLMPWLHDRGVDGESASRLIALSIATVCPAVELDRGRR